VGPQLLDPYRFTRGVEIGGKKALEDVMVRRLKEDIRFVQGGFPRRKPGSRADFRRTPCLLEGTSAYST
jgi:hypothetical protein